MGRDVPLRTIRGSLSDEDAVPCDLHGLRSTLETRLCAACCPSDDLAILSSHESAWFAVTLDFGYHSFLRGTGSAIDLGDLLGRQDQVALVAVLGR